MDTVLGGVVPLHSFGLRMLVYLVPIAAFIFVGITLETFLPVDEHEDDRARAFNLAFTLIVSIVDVTVGVALVAWLSSALTALPVRGIFAIPLYDHGRLWFAIPLALLSLFIGDFFYYWMHRAQHSWDWLWVQHKVHHSDEHMNVTTALRTHWTEVPLHILFINAPIAILFKMPLVTLALGSLLIQSAKYFIHLNARISFGPLNRVFCTPHTHRIHHSALEGHWNKNFASSFSFWDVLFGTHHQPKSGEWPPCGVPGERAQSVAKEVMIPLECWSVSLRRAFRRLHFVRP